MTSYDAMQRLEGLRRRYENTRSAARVAIVEAIDLAEQAIRDAELVETARADGRIEQYEAQREREQSYLETYRTRVRQLEDALAEKRRLHEEREETGEEVQVKIGRGLGGSWTVGDLEEVIYRLRCGGGTDATPVKITDYTATAKVVAPELVPLMRPDSAKVDRAASFAPDLDIVERPKPTMLTERLIAAGCVVAAVLFVLLQVLKLVIR